MQYIDVELLGYELIVSGLFMSSELGRTKAKKHKGPVLQPSGFLLSSVILSNALKLCTIYLSTCTFKA